MISGFYSKASPSPRSKFNLRRQLATHNMKKCHMPSYISNFLWLVLILAAGVSAQPVTTTTTGSSGSAKSAPFNEATEALIAYASRSTASDGEASNSPFTQALLEHVSSPDDIALVLRKVREQVFQTTRGSQETWEQSSLTGGALVLSRTTAAHALVIGNGAYINIEKLRNTLNDARAIGSKLTQLGFAVTTVEDATRSGLLIAMEAFKRSATGGELAVLFYAGHGLQLQGEVYLLPVDVAATDEKSVRTTSVPLRVVVDQYMPTKRRLILYDSALDNPYLPSSR